MTGLQIGAWASLLLPPVAGAFVARRHASPGDVPLRIVVGAVFAGSLVVIPLQVEAALVLAGWMDRITLWGPVLAAGSVLVVYRGGDRPRPARGLGGRISRLAGDPGSSRGIGLAWLLVAGVYGLFGLERLLGYPMSWDGVSYHLPVAAEWLRTGSVAIGPDASFHEAVPAAADLLAMVALGTGWTSVAEVWNVLSLAAAAGGVWLVADRILGRGRDGGGLAALLVLCIPVVLFQTFSSYVDLFVAGYLAAGAGLLARLLPRRSSEPPPPLPLALSLGLAVGLAAGAKPTGWPGAALLVLLGLGAVFLRPGSSRRARLLSVVVLVVASAVPVAFWLARNAVATGSPFYPIEVEILGMSFQGIEPARTRVTPAYGTARDPYLLHWLRMPWREQILGYPYNPGHGLGPVFATFVAPGGLYVCWRLLADGVTGAGWRDEDWSRLGLIGVIAALWCAWWFAVSPTFRFGMIVILLGCALASPFLLAFRRAAPRWFGGLLAASVAVFVAVAALPKVQDLAHQIRHGEWSWEEYYHVPDGYLDLPAGATVVNYDVDKEAWNNFALMGPDFRYRVVSYREARRTVAEWGRSPPCPAFLVDRTPFQVEPRDPEFAPLGLDLRLETSDAHDRQRWRVWRVTAGDCAEMDGSSSGLGGTADPVSTPRTR